jgi:hypothetical protein
VRKISSILLLGVLLFNWCGYRILGCYLERQAVSSLESSLNNQKFDESKLISFKIPAKYISFYSNATHFERIDGQIEIDGIQYSYVKRRLFNDSIEVLCIANDKSTQLIKSNCEFFKLVNDIQHTGQEKKSGSNKNFTVDDYQVTDLWVMNNLFYKEVNPSSFYLITTPSFVALSVDKPPDNTFL